MAAPTSHTRALKPVKLNIVKLFVGTLILIAILLSLLALQLTFQLAASSQTNDKVVQVPTPLRQEIVAKELKVTSETNDKVVQVTTPLLQEVVSKELKVASQTNDKVVQEPSQEVVAKELKVASQTNDKVVQEPSQEVVAKELKATVQITETDFLDTSGKYEKDRVYCMIPFIWNPKIYDASE